MSTTITDQYTWTPTGAKVPNPNAIWDNVASSSNGNNLVATVNINNTSGSIYTSTDSGVVWTKSAGGDGPIWNSVTSDSTGQYLAATALNTSSQGGVYVSSNSGATWPKSSAPTPAGVEQYTNVISSSDGTKLAACIDTVGVYYSSNSGSTWTLIFSIPAGVSIKYIASSSDGTTLFFCFGGTSNGIYKGTFSGSWTWGLTGASSLLSWGRVASDSSGTNLIATVDGSGIYSSNNGGTSWNGPASGSTGLIFESIVANSTGQYLSAASSGQGVFTSIDFGATFVKQIYTPSSFGWNKLGCSSDGTKLVVTYRLGALEGGIYIGVPPLPFVPPPAPVPANTVIGAEQTLSTVNSQYATPITIDFSTYAVTLYIQQLAAALNINPAYIEVETALPGSVKINYKMTIPSNSGVDINNLITSINTLNVNQIPAIVNSVSVLWVVPKSAVTSQSQTTVLFPDPIPPIPPTPSSEVAVITAAMKFSGPGTDINTPGLSEYIYGQFIDDLAAVLTIPASYITILSLLPGSIVVTYAITIPIGSTINVDALVALINSLNQNSPSMATIINTLASLWNILPSTIIVTSYVISVIFIPNYETICFKEGTKILCYLSKGKDIYIPIEQITNTKYIKTYKHGYKKVKYVIKSTIFNSSKSSINKLYVCRKTPENGLIEDLYVTGSHALLYNIIPSEKKELMEKLIEEYDIDYPMKIDGKHKLIAYYDDHFRPYNKEGITNVYHIIIDNENEPYKNYGIYANGALAESSDEFTLARINTKTNANNIGFNTNIRVNIPILNTKSKKTYFEEQMELKQYQQKLFKN